MSKPAICLEQVSKHYLGGRVVALDKIDLSVQAGEFVAVLGASGSGKTTLLNLIGALDVPTSGRVTVDGVEFTRKGNLDRFRAEHVGFIFQMHNLIPTLSAYENVHVPFHGVRRNGVDREARAMDLLEAVGLGDRMAHRPAMLSSGERQRVAIARALANHPRVLLADEPTGSLDAATGGVVMDLICRLNRSEGTTLLVVTHDEKVAARADRVIRLEAGRLAG